VTEQEYLAYLQEMNKSYATEQEFEFRYQLFADKHRKITAWNTRAEVTHTLGHNRFSDWTEHELARLTGTKGITHDFAREQSLPAADLTDSVDWRLKGAVTPPQNQLNCMSGWAFSAVGAIESAGFIESGKLVKLSEQQCLECADGAGSCGGGNQETCFSYAEDDKIESEADYPYNAFPASCWDQPDKGVVGVSSFVQVPKNSVSQLKAAIAKQPTSVTLDGLDYVFQHYIKGIITDNSCGTHQNQSVLAVGYGEENGQAYYIIKNSWGADWGEHGYVRIGYSEDGPGICGVQQHSLYPVTD
jgi:KDEL-tailed cysteine endopeptidase